MWSRFLVVTAVLAGAACSSHRPATWGEVEAGSAPASPAGNGAAVAKSPTKAQEPVTESPSPGPRIDRALQRFTSERALARGMAKTSPAWVRAWNVVLDDIATACELPPRASDLGAFVRARATLEVELDTDTRRGVLLPGDLDERVRSVLRAVNESVVELRAANAPGTMAPSPRLDGDLILRSPLVPMVVSSPFGVRTDPITGQRRYHAGTDLDAPTGSTVYASASGLVVYAGNQGGYGKHVVIDHGGAVRTHYSHLSDIVVAPGQLIEEGDAVGFVGSTGRSTGPHLHFAVTNGDGEFLDPIALIDIPYDTLAAQVKTSGKGKATRENERLQLRLGANDSVEIVSH